MRLLGGSMVLALAIVLPSCGSEGGGSGGGGESGGPPPGGGTPSAFEGFGAVTSGGAGGEVYHVTTLADGGPGSLRAAVTSRTPGVPRTVVFDVGGDITLTSTLAIAQGALTIDGSTAPAPGITLRKASGGIATTIRADDVILTHLRFVGLASGNGNGDNLSLLGVHRVVIDHIASTSADDGALDIAWNGNTDITVSWSLFYGSDKTMIVSYGPNGRLSLHHNVWANNTERNPQLRYENAQVDYRNNIVSNWGPTSWGYGMRIRANEPAAGYGNGRTDANIVNNAFVPGASNQGLALVYGDNPGPADDGGPGGAYPQGTVWASASMGSLYVAGNLLPAANADHYSTVASPLSAAAVTTWPANELDTRVLPTAGPRWRTATEQAILDDIAARMSGM